MSVLLAIACTGCLWICRVPYPTEEKFSDDGNCTKRVWKSILSDIPTKNDRFQSWSVYPLIYMRVYMSGRFCEDDDIPLDKLKETFPERHYDGEDLYEIKWQRRFRWLQYGVLWIGSPIDAVVDTVMLPYDLLKD